MVQDRIGQTPTQTTGSSNSYFKHKSTVLLCSTYSYLGMSIGLGRVGNPHGHAPGSPRTARPMQGPGQLRPGSGVFSGRPLVRK